MTTGEVVLVAAIVLCAIGLAALAVALVRVLDALAALRIEVRDLRDQSNRMISELRVSTDQARDAVGAAREDLVRFDRVLGSAEAISSAVGRSGGAARRVFATPVIKGVGVVTGVKRAVDRLRTGGERFELVSGESKRRRA